MNVLLTSIPTFGYQTLYASHPQNPYKHIHYVLLTFTFKYSKRSLIRPRIVQTPGYFEPFCLVPFFWDQCILMIKFELTGTLLIQTDFVLLKYRKFNKFRQIILLHKRRKNSMQFWAEHPPETRYFPILTSPRGFHEHITIDSICWTFPGTCTSFTC